VKSERKRFRIETMPQHFYNQDMRPFVDPLHTLLRRVGGSRSSGVTASFRQRVEIIANQPEEKR